MKFAPGQSGNPQGRPKGVQDLRVQLRGLLQPHAEALVAKAVEMALAGDTTAMRIVLDRIIPPLKSRDVTVSMRLQDKSLSEQGSSVLERLAEGEITPDEATTIMQALQAQARIVEVTELEQRVVALEARKT